MGLTIDAACKNVSPVCKDFLNARAEGILEEGGVTGSWRARPLRRLKRLMRQLAREQERPLKSKKSALIALSLLFANFLAIFNFQLR